ncbi:MAG: hypothetical protein J6T94_11435 [Bacteroidaceae bacterium]|nr:hypothetical protein [Bacteroidaceae bacterium]
MRGQIEAIEQLRDAVERTIGKTLETNRDFKNLSNSIYDKTRASISATTLKRIWGYISESVTPRRYTLDQLARFIGYDDFEAFCANQTNLLPYGGEQGVGLDAATGEALSKVPSPANKHDVGARFTPRPQEGSSTEEIPSLLGRGWGRGLGWVGLLLVIAAFALWFFLPHLTGDKPSADNNRILKKGQVFASYDDFLPLFGINATESRHYQFVPDEEHIIVWSPQYQNPYYHNEGNPDSLMPTITEYLTLKVNVGENAEAMKEKMRQEHKKAYFTALEKNDVRIVFMKDLVDTSFVFLGIYRFSIVLSDSTKVVWVRATDQCDLDNLSFLNNYRN